jgi:hypothetical protein
MIFSAVAGNRLLSLLSPGRSQGDDNKRLLQLPSRKNAGRRVDDLNILPEEIGAWVQYP